MAILSGIGISLALTSDGNPLLYGIAGGYGISVGCYSPINEFTTNIVAGASAAGYNNVALFPIYIYCIVGFSLSFAVIYFIMGGHKAHGSVRGENVLGNLPPFTRHQLISIAGIIGVLALVTIFGLDVGAAGVFMAVACVLLGCCRCDAAIKGVSLPVLILVSGVGMLVNLISKLGGFTLISTALASIMTPDTASPLMSFTCSVMSLFSIARVCVLTLIPTIPGIITIIPNASADLLIAATSAGAFASCIGPLSSCGALIMQNLSQQVGEEKAMKYFVPQQVMAVIGGFVVALFGYIVSVTGVFV
jgi:di/tricarboxylate transporter